MSTPYSKDETLATQRTLSEAVDSNHSKSFDEFKAAYLEFLKRFDTFNESFSLQPTPVQTHSAIFGHHCFFLNQTDDSKADHLLDNANAASKVMAEVPMQDRVKFLDLLEQKIKKYEDAIMTTITADTGKPIELAKGEMGKGAEWFAYARDEATKQLTTSAGKIRSNRKPVGSVQVIGAYNYPYALAIGGIVGGLGAGNGVIVSAPLKAPNWVFPFMQAAREASHEFADWAASENKPYAKELKEQADNMVQYSVGVNNHLTQNAGVVHFVGSDHVGNIISTSRGKKPTILEMGGSNVVTVMASALEKKSAQEIAEAIYGGFGPATGQRCTAPRFLCVQHGAEDVTKILSDICEQGPKDGELGNPFKSGVKIGPLVDRGAHQNMKLAIETAESVGAKVYGNLTVSNNKMHLSGDKDSYWVNPIVIDWSGVDTTNAENVRRMNETFKNEIFGPLIHIVKPVATLDDAIATTQHLDNHHLAAAIFTNNPQDVEKFGEQVSVTSLMVNAPPKDQSPKKPHGHPGLATIGGHDHFTLYTQGASKENARMGH